MLLMNVKSIFKIIAILNLFFQIYTIIVLFLKFSIQYGCRKASNNLKMMLKTELLN